MNNSVVCETERFLKILAPEDTHFTFQSFDDLSERKDSNLVRVFHGTFAEHRDTLQKLNDRGAGIFVTVNRTDLKGRCAANIVAIRALFVDLDGSPLDPVLEAVVPPDIVVESSANRYHAYWLVRDCPLESFKTAQQSLALKFDGDKSCCDLPRVLRLPGFWHRKSADAWLTSIVSVREDSLV